IGSFCVKGPSDVRKHHRTDRCRIETLAGAALDTSEAAVQRLLASVGDLRDAVVDAPWDIIQSAIGLTDHRRIAAEGLREKLTEALEADEHVVQLRPAIGEVKARATRLLTDTRSGESTTPPPPTPPYPPPPPPEEEVVDERSEVVLDGAEAAATLDILRSRVMAEPGSKLTITWRLTGPRLGGRG